MHCVFNEIRPTSQSRRTSNQVTHAGKTSNAVYQKREFNSLPLDPTNPRKRLCIQKVDWYHGSQITRPNTGGPEPVKDGIKCKAGHHDHQQQEAISHLATATGQSCSDQDVCSSADEDGSRHKESLIVIMKHHPSTLRKRGSDGEYLAIVLREADGLKLSRHSRQYLIQRYVQLPYTGNVPCDMQESKATNRVRR